MLFVFIVNVVVVVVIIFLFLLTISKQIISEYLGLYSLKTFPFKIYLMIRNWN